MYLSKNDIDYWHALSEEEREWLNGFLAEHYGGNKTSNSPTLAKIKTDNPNLTEDQAEEVYRQFRNDRKRRNYSRKSCALNKSVSVEEVYIPGLSDRASGFED